MIIENFKKVDEKKIKYRVRTLMKKRIREFDLSKYEFAVMFGISVDEIDEVLLKGFDDLSKNLAFNFILSNSKRFLDFVNTRISYGEGT